MERKDKDKRDVVQCLFLIFQVGISMMVPLALGGVCGYYAGKWLGMEWFIIPGLFLGGAAGYRNIYQMLRKYMRTTRHEKKRNVITAEELLKQEAEREFLIWKEKKRLENEK